MKKSGAPSKPLAASGPLLLIDGHALLFRAFHALPPLTSPRGEPTGAIYGFLRILYKAVSDTKAESVAVVFDAAGESFRDGIYKEYKAHREATPDALAKQIPVAIDLVRDLGFPTLVVPGVEADDVIATLVRRKKGVILIFSGDKDLAALVSDRVKMLVPGHRFDGFTLRGEAEVQERFGVAPDRIPDLLALMGDASDNIPGVPGIGPKRAVEILRAGGSVPEILENPPEKIAPHLDVLRLSWELVQLRTDVKLDVTDLRPAPPSAAARERILALGMKSILASIGKIEEPVAAPTPVSSSEAANRYENPPFELRPPVEIPETSDLDRLSKRLVRAEEISLDTETDSLVALQANLLGVSLATDDGAWYLPVRHDESQREGRELLDEKRVADLLRALLAKTPRVVGHNIKYDFLVLSRIGVSAPPGDRVLDSMIASYLLTPETRAHSLDALALARFGHTNIAYDEVIPDKKSTLASAPLSRVATYAGEDARVALALARSLERDIGKAGLRRILGLESAVLPVLVAMEIRGIALDPKRLGVIAEGLRKEIEALRRESIELAGKDFNPASTQQLAKILFEDLKLPVVRKGKTGPSTDAEVLEILAAEHPLPRVILDLRVLSKLANTYVEALPTLLHPQTRRIHTSFNQAVAATGRLSSSDPNLQNIPIRTARGREVRAAFVAGRGLRLVVGDYSQIELRIIAHLSGDEALRAAFARGEDVHEATARALGCDRSSAKAVNYGLAYGQTAFGLARTLRVPRHEADRILSAYHAKYPRVREWVEATLAAARTKGYAETLWGRRRPLPEITARNGNIRAAAERIAINMPVQGTAADLAKAAMVAVAARLAKEHPKADLLLQVHDELVAEAPAKEAKAVGEVLREEMERAMTLDVPIVAEVGIGEDWLDAKG